MRALIIDQWGSRAALGAARALARDGWIVGCASPGRCSLATHSRAVAHSHDAPYARLGPEALLPAVNRAIAEVGYEVVFSLDDVGVLGLSRHRDRLDATFPYGAHDGLLRAFDKLDLIREAQRAGLGVPRTAQAPIEERGLEAVLRDFGAGPLVVKPRMTFVEGADGHVRARVVNAAQVADSLREVRAAGAEPIIQEQVEGKLMALTALTDRDARIVTQVQQISDLRWPVDVGISARAHTVAVQKPLAAAAARLLEALGWFGLAQMQFIIGEDGVPRLIDFNGRFYGSIALAIAAGPNLPGLWARLATRRPITPPRPARAGVRYQWLAGDMRASEHGAPGLGRAPALLGSILRAPRAVHGVWSASDPWPAFVHARSRASDWMQRKWTQRH